jgi:hypothetical protein
MLRGEAIKIHFPADIPETIIPLMLLRDAKALAETWAKEHLSDYLLGKQLVVPDFPNEKTARYFNPERSLDDHQLVISALVQIARHRGAQILYVTLTRDDYDAFLAKGLKDDLETRMEFVRQSWRLERFS